MPGKKREISEKEKESERARKRQHKFIFRVHITIPSHQNTPSILLN